MKQIFNWTIGSFFRTIGRIVAYFIIGAIIALILMYKPKAATLTSYDTYAKIMNQESGCGTANRYSYTQYSNNDPAGDLWQTGSFNTQYSGKAAILYFNFQYNLTAGKYYDVDINFNTSDLSSSLTTSNVYVDSGTSCQDLSGDRVSLIGFTLSNSGTNYSNKATIRIMANTATTYWGIQLYKGVGQYVTGVNNWRINSITINEVDPSNTNIVIDNATNNTTNIINNNNENTQQIIDNQNELLGSKCSNLFNKNDITTGLTFNNSGGTTNLTNSFVGNSFIPISTSNVLTISIGTNSNFTSETDYRLMINEYDSSYNWIKRNIFFSRTATFQLSSNTKYFKIGASTITKDELMVNFGSLKPYCEYGSYSSKLDETTNAIDNLTDTLTDTNTDNDANDLSSYFNNIDLGSHSSLASIVLLPVNFLSQLLDSTSNSDICTTWRNKQICFPSGSLIWSRNNATIETFKTFFQLVVGGYLFYKCLLSIFNTAQTALQPDKTEVEVMKL